MTFDAFYQKKSRKAYFFIKINIAYNFGSLLCTGCGTQTATGPEIYYFIKNPQFLPKQAFIQVILTYS